eukprot:15465786-Alexandrium_andersonii.AAC.1
MQHERTSLSNEPRATTNRNGKTAVGRKAGGARGHTHTQSSEGQGAQILSKHRRLSKYNTFEQSESLAFEPL